MAKAPVFTLAHASTPRREKSNEIETPAGIVRFKVVEKTRRSRAIGARDYSVFLRTEGTEKYLGFSSVYCGRISGTYSLETEKEHLSRIFNGASTAQILSFFPFGVVLDGVSRYKRKGIGGALLKQIIDDCGSGGIRLLCVVTNKPEMQALLAKFGFENALKRLFYLDLLREQ